MSGRLLKFLAAGACAAAFSFTGEASAATLTYTAVGITYTDQITIDYPDPAGVNTYVGMFQLTTTSGTVDVFCVDLFHDIDPSGGVYSWGKLTNDSKTPPPPNALSPKQIGEIGALVARAQAFMKASTDPADVAAAIQLAIWTVEYPAFAFDESTANSRTLSYYNTYLGDVGTWPWNTAYDALISVKGQTLAETQNLVTTPEPSTWAMMLLGFAGLAYSGWRTMRTRAA